MQLLFFNSWVSDETLKALCWTLIHSLWQGLLAAVLAGIIILCTRRSPARLRYNLLGAVLILFSLAAIVTFYGYTESSMAGTVPANTITEDLSPAFITTDNVVTAAAGTSAIDTLINYFNKNADLFVLLWAVFFLVHCIKLLTGFAGVQRLSSYKTHAPSENWQAKLDQLGKKLRVQQSVRLLQSELVKVPVAAGIFKPVILVPLGLLSNLPPEQVETILMHELAHIRRKDYLINILQRFTEAVFFFNPALLWISSLLRQEREACCDDIVIAHTHHKGNYLEALVSFQEYSLAGTAYAMAISSKKHYLLNRVKRMLTQENKKLNLMEKILLVAGLAVMTAFTFIPQQEKSVKETITATTINNEKEGANASLTNSADAVIPAAVTRHSNKREMKRETIVNQVKDTIPPKKENANGEVKKFRSMSSTINDDGKTRTENISITDQDGKKYSFTRINGKVTDLTVDDKKIPENEMALYAPVIEKIDRARQEDQLRKMKDMQLRKVDLEKRKADLKEKNADMQKQKELQRKDMLKQKEEYHKTLEKAEQQKEVKQKEEYRLQKAEQQKELNQKLKETQKILQRKMKTPTINGREVVQNDRKEIEKEKEYDVDLRSEIALNKKIELNNHHQLELQKKIDHVNIKIEKVKYDLNLKGKVDGLKLIELKNDLHKEVNMKYDLKLKDPLKPLHVPKSPTAPGKPDKKKPEPAKEPIVTA